MQKWCELDPNLKSFAQMAVAAQVGCSWCLDFGYFQAHNEGLDETKASDVPPGSTQLGVGGVSGEAAFAAHRRLLFTVAYEMLGSAADAEDVAGDVVAVVARRPRGRARPPGLLGPHRDPPGPQPAAIAGPDPRAVDLTRS